ncbi:GNAT family N-acetyltransferase [Georgenia deserti]|uniref:GNAT family N-acetyltransferase n=1 Tax=Georgenia deserti TaxID=2093781 RepID=A0ABW4L955_9MICO
MSPSHAGQAAADVSVRPALPEDATTLGAVHARTLRATLAAGVGRDLGPQVAAMIDPAALADQWSRAITAPPSPRHRVLTAVDGARIVGFAAFAPAEVPVEVRGPDRTDDAADAADSSGETDTDTADQAGPTALATAEPGEVAELLALEVPAAEGRRGHGSRLLAACADLLREQGAARLQTWVVREDEVRTRFLAQAGFAPAGVRRTLDVAGEDVTEVCWYAEL